MEEPAPGIVYVCACLYVQNVSQVRSHICTVGSRSLDLEIQSSHLFDLAMNALRMCALLMLQD